MDQPYHSKTKVKGKTQEQQQKYPDNNETQNKKPRTNEHNNKNRAQKEKKSVIKNTEQSKQQTTNIGTWNIRSIKGKEVEIIEEMEKANLKYMGITETKKKGKGLREMTKGYWLYWSGVDEAERARAGVGLLIRQDQITNVLGQKYVNERILKVYVEIGEGKEKWTLMVAYGPNEDADAETKDSFYEKLQEELDEEGSSVIIMGDLNGRVGNNNIGYEKILGKEGEVTRNNNGKRIMELCIDNELIIANTKFTHKEIHKITREEHSKGERSIIDYFLVSNEIWTRVTDVKVTRGAEIGSDHYLLRMKIRDRTTQQKEPRRLIIKKKIKSYKLNEPDTKRIYQGRLEEKLKEENSTDKINDKWKILKGNIIQAAEDSCGTTKIGNHKVKRTAWWSEEIKNKVKEKKEKWKKYLQSKNKQDYEEYQSKRKIVKDRIKKAKQKTWEEFGNKMKESYKDNQKLFYGTLKQMRNKKKATLKNIRDEHGNILTKEEDIMERWKQYFQTLLKEGEQEAEAANTENIETKQGHEPEEKTEELTISREELEAAIRKMKMGKAAGHDNITAEMIKHMGEKGKEKLLEMMNGVIKEGKTPDDWKKGIITPIFKKGDSKDCKNYRGITLLSVPGKIYARILETKLRKTLDNTLEDSQCGFRENKGTQDLIFTLRQLCEKTIKSGGQLHLSFVDLEKAFDCINREDVWESLTRRGTRIQEIQAIKILYDNNTNYVRTRNEESQVFQTKIGLRQGCVLSPLLFSMVIDDAVKESRKETRKYMAGYWKMEKVEISELLYADDMVIIGHTEQDLQHNMNIYNRELRKKNMRINKEKTKTMIITTTRITHNIEIEGTKIEQVEKFKYLGTYISSDGKLDDEIDERIGATARLFNALRTPFLGKKEIPQNVKVEVFKKIAVPILTYGSEAWTTSDRQRSRIQGAEMRFLRKIEGKTRRDKIRNSAFRQKLNTKPVEITIEENQLRWLGHVLRMNEERTPRRIYEARSTGSKKRGRPRKSWKETVKYAAERRGVEWRNVLQLAQDRNQWREMWKLEPT